MCGSNSKTKIQSAPIKWQSFRNIMLKRQSKIEQLFASAAFRQNELRKAIDEIAAGIEETK